MMIIRLLQKLVVHLKQLVTIACESCYICYDFTTAELRCKRVPNFIVQTL